MLPVTSKSLSRNVSRVIPAQDVNFCIFHFEFSIVRLQTSLNQYKWLQKKLQNF